MTKLKKFILSLLIFSISFMSILPATSGVVYGQDWFDQPYRSSEGWYAKVYGFDNPEEIFGERYTAAQVQWIFYSIFSVFSNYVPGRDVSYCLWATDSIAQLTGCLVEVMIRNNIPLPPWVSEPDNISGVQYVQPVELIEDIPQAQEVSAWDIIVSNQPISGIRYLNNTAYKLNPVKDVRAQGFGFEVAADPMRELWQLSRDVAYFFLVIAAIVMAFMIMFRVKLNPQTVISVQSAIPKLIIALILITFSYAIAGFLIDLMYLVIGILALILHTATFTNSSNIAEMFVALTQQWGVLNLMTTYASIFVAATIGALLHSNLIGGGVGIYSLLFPQLLQLLINIFLFIITIRVLWTLLKAYVMVLLLILIGPFQILFGAVSTGNAGFSNWIKSIAAQLAVFPATALMFVLSFVFLKAAEGTSALSEPIQLIVRIILWFTRVGGGWTDDYPFFINESIVSSGTGTWAPPLTVGGGSIELVWLGVSLVFISLIPNVANIIQGFISGQGFGYGSAIGQAFGVIPAAGQRAWGRTAPIRQYETGRGVWEGKGLIGGTLSRLGVDQPRRESIASSIYGYRHSGKP